MNLYVSLQIYGRTLQADLEKSTHGGLHENDGFFFFFFNVLAEQNLNKKNYQIALARDETRNT